MSLRESPHTVSIWRRVDAGQSDYGEQKFTHDEVATGVAFDVQLSSGSIEPRVYGRAGTGDYEAFAPTGTNLKQGDLVRIDSSTVSAMVGRIFEVKSFMDWGTRGELQAVVCDSEEEILDGDS